MLKRVRDHLPHTVGDRGKHLRRNVVGELLVEQAGESLSAIGVGGCPKRDDHIRMFAGGGGRQVLSQPRRRRTLSARGVM
jgi:hypothetical protein